MYRLAQSSNRDRRLSLRRAPSSVAPASRAELLGNTSSIRARAGARIGTTDAATTSAKLAWPVRILVVSLFLPWIFTIGPLALSPYRLCLMVSIIPTLVSWMNARADRIRFGDVALF